MESISYEEAREWFWVRTAVWAVPAAILSTIVCFAYFGSSIEEFRTRLLLSIAAGVGSTLLGVLAARVSRQFSWMRLGRRWGWLPNIPLCGVISAVGAAIICSVILSVMRDNIYNPASEEVRNAAYDMMLFSICLSAWWGMVFGGWFALRRDKYFIEPI